MSTKLRLPVFVLIVFAAFRGYAQAPIISYSSPQTYNVGTAITPLTPTSSGVAAPGFGSPVQFGTGYTQPNGIAVTAAGYVYVTDINNNNSGDVEKTFPTGGQTHIVESGLFYSPGITVDAAGNIYINDEPNSDIDMIPPSGNGVVSIATGLAPGAISMGIVADAAGNIYFSDAADGVIEKLFTATGIIRDWAKGFSNPQGLALDASGNLYVADNGNGAIKMVPAGGGTPVTISTSLSGPHGIAVDAEGNIYVIDDIGLYYHVVKKIAAGSGAPVTISGQFSYAFGVAVDASGNVYVADNDLDQVGVSEIKLAGGYFINPALPPGLNFDNTTGIISGTPTVASPATNYTVTAFNGNGSGTATLNIQVIVIPPPPPSITYSSPQIYTPGKAITALSPSVSVGSVAAPGYYSSPVTLASGLNGPTGVGVDAAGNLYVADNNGNAVSKIPAGGGAPVVVGSGFNHPTGIAVDALGNIFVADFGSNSIKKVPAGGGTPVVIGSGFLMPYAVAVDAAGNVYVSDNGNNQVKRIPVGGGPPVILASGFNMPGGVAVDAFGNIYVGDTGNHAVKEIPAGGGSIITIGTGFSQPNGVTVDATGNLFVADYINHNITEFPANGTLPVTISSNMSGPASSAIDGGGNLYVADLNNNAVLQIKPNGGFYINAVLPMGLNFNNTTGVISGTPTAASAAKNYTVTAYNAYGSGAATVNIQVLKPPTVSYASPQTYVIGTAITALKPGSSGVAAFAYSSSPTMLSLVFSGPQGVTTDSKGNIYVADTYNNAIKMIPAGGGSPVTLGSGFNAPTGVAVDVAGNVYVADSGDDAVKIIPTGNGTPVSIGNGAGFSAPAGVAVDASGNVYVADLGNSQIVKIPAGNGTPVTLGSGFLYPSGVAVDAAGNVYVADRSHNAVKKIPATGGTPVTLGSGFNLPSGIAVDPAGNVFIADEGNNVIKIMVAGSGTPIAVGAGFSAPAGVAEAPNGALLIADAGNNRAAELLPVGGYYLNSFLPAGLLFNGGTGTISGTPTVVSPAANYTVTVYNAAASATAILNIRVSPNFNLSGLALSNGTLSPSFSATTTAYSTSVGYNLKTMTVTPTASDPAATITVNGNPVTSATASPYLPLVAGANVIPIVVTAKDGVSKQTYSLTVNEAHSSNNNLAGLKVSSGTLSPAFAAATTSYSESVNYSVSKIAVTPTTADNTATVKVNGVSVPSGTASAAITLNVGANAITTVVTAQNGTTKTYTITVTRQKSTNASLSNITLSKGALSPAFTAATTSYTDMVSNGTTSVTLTPTVADTAATVTVNGTAVVSGKATGAITLVVGNNVITTIVTAQDGSTKNTYTVNVIRPSTNAKLSALKISVGTLTPAFNANSTSYTVAETNATSTVTVTPTVATAGATVKVNGTAVASSAASGAIALAVGSNTITTVVTAQDGVTTDTYTITVTRAATGENIPDEAVSVNKPAEIAQVAEDGISVHPGLSPNGDGIDDFLQIDNIARYPDNKLSIMNRNGMLVFEAKGYDNSTKVFDGRSNKNGQMQLPGTYFYSLDYTVGGIIKHKTGFLVLKY